MTLSESRTSFKKKVSVTGCFTIPFPCFTFCHFSIILGISVWQAFFAKLPLFHRFLYFMISACSSSVVQREAAAWGNQAVAVTCKPQAVSARDWHDMSVVLVKKLGGDVTERPPEGHPNLKSKQKRHRLTTINFLPRSIMNDFLPVEKRGKCERVVRFQVDTAVVPTPTVSCVSVSCLSCRLLHQTVMV